MLALPSSSTDAPPDVTADTLLPEMRQSGLLLGLSFAVLGLTFVVARLLSALH